MNITFEWNDVALSPEQKAGMEENIRKEMPGLEGLSNYKGALMFLYSKIRFSIH